MLPLAPLAILEASVKLALLIAQAVQDQKLMDVGAALEIKTALVKGLGLISAANTAAKGVVNSSEAVDADPNNLDHAS